jgi:hypothetical protein
MTAAALIVSIIALVLSVASLSWQAYSWSRAGPIVTLRTGWAYGVGGLDGEKWIVITAHNSGRGSVQITGWALDTPNGQTIVAVTPGPHSTPLSRPLDGGSEAQWFMAAAAVQSECTRLGTRVEDLLARVTLGSGKAAVARHRGIGKASA